MTFYNGDNKEKCFRLFVEKRKRMCINLKNKFNKSHVALARLQCCL